MPIKLVHLLQYIKMCIRFLPQDHGLLSTWSVLNAKIAKRHLKKCVEDFKLTSTLQSTYSH